VRGKAGESLLVDHNTGLVGDLDRHGSTAAR
jgi:hypothetical protein